MLKSNQIVIISSETLHMIINFQRPSTLYCEEYFYLNKYSVYFRKVISNPRSLVKFRLIEVEAPTVRYIECPITVNIAITVN